MVALESKKFDGEEDPSGWQRLFWSFARHAELALQFALAKLGDSNRAAFLDTLEPAAFKQMIRPGRSERAGQMVASFAPIEALPGENATGLS